MAEHTQVDMDIYANHLNDLQKLAIVMRVYVTPIMHRIGQQLRAEAVGSIERQIPPGGGAWAPLSTAHLNWKKKQGLSTNIYTMTSTYMQNIAAVYDEAEMRLEVGVFRGVMHAPVESKPGATGVKAVELYWIAEVLEYGHSALKIPARPLWRPLLQDKEHSIKTQIGIALKQARDHVQRHMPPVPGDAK